MKRSVGYWIGVLSCLSLAGCAESSSDAPVTKPVCGNGTCEASETAQTCSADCKASFVCGNGTCELGETHAMCPADCKASENGEVCGDGVCDDFETYSNCPADCVAKCGNGICETPGGETFESCPADCVEPERCGNGICSPAAGETTENCSVDCKAKIRCGDGSCDTGETRLNCPSDCAPVCGDGRCESSDSIKAEWRESETSCPDDCEEDTVIEYKSVCGDGVCDEDENETSCADDCSGHTIEIPALTMDEFNSLEETSYRILYDFDRVSEPAAGPSGESNDDALARQLSDFFAFPYPSAARTDEYGRPVLKHYPLPIGDSILELVGAILPSAGKLLPSLLDRAQTERAGFSPIGGSYFRTSVAVDQKTFPEPADTVAEDSCFQLINIEESSSHYGERVPLYVSFHRKANRFWTDNTLVMRPVPGHGAHPGDRYVSVVLNNDKNGKACLSANAKRFNQSNKLRYILEKKAPAEINDKMQPYVEGLEKLIADGRLKVKMEDIRAMTGYYAMNPATEMDQMAADLKGRVSVVTDEKGVAKGEWIKQSSTGWVLSKLNVNVFQGEFKTMNYMEGSFPYTGNGEGEMRFDTDGKLVSKGKEETVRFSVVVPNTEMPENGWPIAVYGHGTGGDRDTHCMYGNDEGIVVINGGYPGYGKKPTEYAVPMAMIGFDASLHGTRGDGKDISTADFFMMILKNPVSVRESWRQTVLDMVALYDILGSNKLVLPPIPGSSDDRNVIFDPSYGMYMGHSQGSQEAGLLLGVTGEVKNAFLSAGGAGILISFVDLHPDMSGLNNQYVDSILKDKSVADIFSMILGGQDNDISYDTFITNHIIQPLVDPIDPLNYTHRFIKEPLEGWEPKNIAQTIGLGDQDTPQNAQFTMISAIGLPPVGELFEVTEPMKLAGFTKSTGNSVSNNVTTSTGKVTGGSMQFNYTGTSNPHFVIYHMDSARMAYVNFFRSVVNGTPTVSVSGSQEGDN